MKLNRWWVSTIRSFRVTSPLLELLCLLVQRGSLVLEDRLGLGVERLPPRSPSTNCAEALDVQCFASCNHSCDPLPNTAGKLLLASCRCSLGDNLATLIPPM